MGVRSEPPRLEGAPNFRDLGGLPTVDGRFTRRGVLFRSGGLEELTARVSAGSVARLEQLLVEPRN